ncbi:MAG: hypothetical protein ACE5HJ_08805 [Thermoplasmata archaeon]
MTEDVVVIFPAFEIWGLNRKKPCTILLSDERMIVLKEERGDGRRPFTGLTREIESRGLQAFLRGPHYSLPFDRIRWVQVKPSLMGALLKIQTPGGGYRFRVGRRHSRRLEERLRDVLGERVKRLGE